MTKLLSAGQYAEHLGVRKETVLLAIKKGRITAQRGGPRGSWQIDVETADRQWAESRLKSKINASAAHVLPDKNTTPKGAHPENHITISEAERREKIAKAKLSELKLKEQESVLVSAEKVKKDAFDCARKTRDALLAIPLRIGHQLAAETDPHEVEVMLTKEINDALERLTENEK